MPLTRARVVASPGEPGAVEINGCPLPEGVVVTGVGLQFAEGRVPVLTLAVEAEGVLEVEGVVRVVQQGDEIDYLRQFVANLDPEEFDRMALKHADGLNSRPGEMFKAALMEMIG